MERPMDEQENDIKCPSCGVVIKITAPAFTFCPVCGASLPEMSPSQKIASKNVPKMISLEQAVSGKTRSTNSWTLKEFLNLYVLTIIITLMARYIFLSFWFQGNQGSELPFDPGFVVVMYLTGAIAGIIPILYILHYKLVSGKICWNKLVRKQWSEALVLGVACGVILYFFDVITSILNAAIYFATGWSLFSQGGTFQSGYDAFITSNFPWNKLLVVFPLGFQLVISEVFYRGTIMNGALQNRQGRHGGDWKKLANLQALLISIGLNTLFAFTILFFDGNALFFQILSNLIVGVLFIRTKNVQSCMIAQLVYVILILIL